MSDRTPQNQDKYVLRLPDGMRDRIKAAAEQNNRSMNAEIVATLEAKYPAIDPMSDVRKALASYFEGVRRRADDAGKSVEAELARKARDFMGVCEQSSIDSVLAVLAANATKRTKTSDPDTP